MIGTLKENLRKIPINKFEEELFDASCEYLKNTSDKLSYNSFAYSMRELLRNILGRLAPEEEVKKCCWYKPEKDKEGKEIITRTQRLKFAIQGGLKDYYLEHHLKIKEIKTDIQSLVKQINTLSNYTHISPKTFNINFLEVTHLRDEVISTLNKIVYDIINVREIVKNKLFDILESEIESVCNNDFANDIDWLATHTQILFHSTNETSLDSINSNDITICASVSVVIQQQYGSDGDARRGDGWRKKECVEIDLNFTQKINELPKIKLTKTAMNYDDSLL